MLKGRSHAQGAQSPPLLTVNGIDANEIIFAKPQSLQGKSKPHQGIELFDGDVIQVGVFHFLQIHIPRKPRQRKREMNCLTVYEEVITTIQESRLLESVYHDFLRERRLAAHLDVQRELNAITKHREKSRLMALKAFSPSANEVPIKQRK